MFVQINETTIHICKHAFVKIRNVDLHITHYTDLRTVVRKYATKIYFNNWVWIYFILCIKYGLGEHGAHFQVPHLWSPKPLPRSRPRSMRWANWREWCANAQVWWSRRRATFPQGLEVQVVARSPPIGGSPPRELANSGEHPPHRRQHRQEPSLSPPILSPLLSFSCICMLCTLRAPIPNRPSLIYLLHSVYDIVSQVAPRSFGGRPSLTSSLERHTTQGCIFRVRSLFGPPEKCKTFSLADAFVFHYNTTSYNSGARLDILKNDTYSRPVNKLGYSCGPEIFKAIEAIGALQREATVKDKDMAARKNIVGRTSGTINAYGLPKCV